ncbi:MAG: helix-turn-helix transcriptional regulator [Clostridia bacterium]|nr:helix-turn-helix transcriptional regulator [Clostridia bacterium]
MIAFQNHSLSYSYMGLFDRTGTWIHPTVTCDTYEIIFVTEGEVPLFEEENVFHLKKGDLLLLSPFMEHGGSQPVEGRTSFYWLHFQIDSLDGLSIPKQCTPDAIRTERRLKELMQCQERGDTTVAELILARFLLEDLAPIERKSKSAHEIAEYVRIHASEPLTVAKLAERFHYTPDYLCRLLRSEFGMGAKELIVEKRLAYIQSLLLNTNDSVKEIAYRCGFEDENIFIKFFKYHEQRTPTEFRNEFFRIHMNTR